MKIKLNSVLIALTILTLSFFFFADKAGTYLKGSEPEIYLLLIITLISLIINISFKSEFLEILNVVFIFFYICRIPFVFSTNLASDVIDRNVDMAAIPSSIAILTIQYLVLVICILFINPRIPRRDMKYCPESVFKKVFYFSFIIIAVNCLYTSFVWKLGAGTSSHIIAIAQTVFTLQAGVMLLVLSASMVEKKITAYYKFGIFCSLFLVVASILYQGSKSGLLQVMLIAYLARVVVFGPFVFSLRSLLYTTCLGVVSIVLFFIGSAFNFYQRGILTADQIVDRSFNATTGLSVLLNGFSYRIGYLDFYIQKITNPVYHPYVSFKYYFMSVVDSLTPGFDVFNATFLSRTLFNVYFGTPDAGTNSEIITLFAESHLLLGFFSFLLYLFILFLVKRLAVGYKSSSVFACYLFYMYMVSLFYSWVVGFGLDMLIPEAVYKAIFVFFTIWFIRTKVIVSELSLINSRPSVKPAVKF
jgi:hypothetical protein